MALSTTYTSSLTEEDSKSLTLPFNVAKQEALLGYLLMNEKFFMQARHRIRIEWWTGTRLAQIWNLMLKLAEKYGRKPSVEELKETPLLLVEDLAEINKTRLAIDICIKRCSDFGLDMLQAELTDWYRCRLYVSAMKRSEALFNLAARNGQNTEKLMEAFEMVKKMTRELDDASFDEAAIADMTNPVGDINGQILDASQAISFGLPALDRLMLPEGNGLGSLLRGDMTVLLAPTNVGKTTCMVTIMALNILAGKDVLLLTHEGRLGDIKLKIWQSMTGCSRQELMEGIGRPDFMAALEEVKSLVNAHLEYMPLNKAGLTIEEVEASIRRRNDRWRATHQGKGFDLIIDDYAAKLTTQQARGGQFAMRQIHEVVYNYFSQIALEQDVHVITAIQTNREGSKVNKKFNREAQRLLSMEDVAEAWGPMTTATNVISINRPPDAQARGITIYHICKSRSSEVGWAVACRSNFAAAQAHDPISDATWYRGTSPMAGKIEDLLSGFKGAEVPFEEVLKVENAVATA